MIGLLTIFYHFRIWLNGNHTIGPTGENNTEIHAILAEYGLPYVYPAAVEKAADKIDAVGAAGVLWRLPPSLESLPRTKARPHPRTLGEESIQEETTHE